ncbi:hypothetical protein Btru_046185 [Bulinus truncatus]|nr:hypothetical protein Btru_046185 [Bulinus truncatus]
MAMQTTVKVAVVGAGAAGLCAVRHFNYSEDCKGNVRFAVTCFEQSCRVGGTWFYTESVGRDENGLPVHSSMYKNLRTNLPVQCMAFPDFPFKSDSPSFVTHNTVQQYLEDYASHYGLLKYIKFLTLVKWIQPIAVESSPNEVKWKITTSNVLSKDDQKTEIFDAVLICNGHYADPLIPEIPGLDTFTGQISHSHDYRDPASFADKVVLILGAGSSGQDISLELATVAKQVYLSHSKPPLVSKLPENMQQKQGVAKINDSVVEFVDGSQALIDALMFCTGYNYNFSFLAPGCGIQVQGGRITPLFKHIINTKYPSLALVGICKVIVPFPMFDVQIRFFRSVLDGSFILPSEEMMNDDTEKDYRKRLEDGMPHRYAHTMGSRQFGYNDDLADLAKMERLPSYYSQVYHQCHQLRLENLVGYKKCNFQANHAGDSFHVVSTSNNHISMR